MAETSSLDSLMQLVHDVKRNLHQQIEQLQLGITPMHVRVLKIIYKQPQCSAIDIASLLNRDKAQVTRLLNTLLEQGLIEKHANPLDKRSQRLQITAAGQSIIDKVTQIDSALHRKMTQGLDEQQLHALQQISSQMRANLNA